MTCRLAQKLQYAQTQHIRVVRLRARIAGPYAISSFADLFVVGMNVIHNRLRGPVDSLCNAVHRSSLTFLSNDAPMLKISNRVPRADVESRVLEYCIKENPEEILTRMLGFMLLKKIARNLGFRRVHSLHNQHEVATLILLRLGFSVPPTLTGLKHYTSRLQNCKTKIVGIADPTIKSGLMSQVYVDMEGFFRSLLFFYVGFLWSDEIEKMRWSVKHEDAFRRLLKNKLKIRNPERITFGETIHAIRKLNKLLKDSLKFLLDKHGEARL